MHRVKCDDDGGTISQEGERVTKHTADSTWAILCITLSARGSLDFNCVQLAKA